MWFLLAVLLVGLVSAVLIALYVNYTRLGTEVPRAAWLGRLMGQQVESLPTLEAQFQIEREQETAR